MVNNNYKELINESYEKFTDDVDIMWQKSKVGDLDDFIYDGLIISGYDENNKWFGRLPTEEEFINKVKSDEGFSKRWGIKIGERELSLEDRQKLCVVWTEDSYGIDGELRSPLTIDWEKTPKQEIKVTYNGKTEIGYE